ncbi:sodium/calcium exchanger NCL [Heracleum sosnowskyi]|uniref:Sodium/calcium exchanger NCL n=1 Tax=Heracleum sosnowskyi TaxID=360622 RepID=A0AAD8N5R9_9APIA|nr:sodium/calcium exchanger NCL [Heracleum sosnowskyi]
MLTNKKVALPLLLLLALLSCLLLASQISARRIPCHANSDVGRIQNVDGLLEEEEEATTSCEQTYGFLPCTNTGLGNFFLILVYAYLMYVAATFLSHGSELLLDILGPGIIGGLFLPLLGALPDALLILVSGLSGSANTAQSQVSVGMGLLAGSTVMLLTVIWGTCVIVGKCDIENSVAIDGKDTKGFDLRGSGVSTDIWTSYAAMIMVVSLIPFIVVQFPQILHSTSGRHSAVLIALVISVLLLISYCIYQVFQPWIQSRKLAYTKDKHVKSGILKSALGILSTDQGTPNEEVIEKLFKAMDLDCDGYLTASELRALVLGIQFDQINLNHDDAVAKLMKDFDKSADNQVDLQEFIGGIAEWLEDVNRSKASSLVNGSETIKYLNDYHEQKKREYDLLGEQSDEAVELFLLILCESVSAVIFASRKKLRSASLTFSEIYGAATMNNILCLSVFLALVYVRGLVWDFSSEVVVIIIVCVVMGLMGSISTTFPLWTTSIAFLLYPLSLVLVYVLDYIFGWS